MSAPIDSLDLRLAPVPAHGSAQKDKHRADAHGGGEGSGSWDSGPGAVGLRVTGKRTWHSGKPLLLLQRGYEPRSFPPPGPATARGPRRATLPSGPRRR